VTRRRVVALLVVLTLLAVAVGCSDDDTDEPTPTSTSAPATTGTTAPASTRPGETTPVRVYFVRAEKVATAGRAVQAPAVARGALQALLEGPDGDESAIGMSSAVPDGTRLLGVNIAGGTATVDLSDAFQDGGGTLSVQLRVAEVVFTLTQFPSVQDVSIRIDGESVTAIGAEGVPATDLDRSDFQDVTPLILVESPVPGQQVASPLTISGIANTFEAQVNYEVTAGGQVLADGFTMASVGSGIFGDFSVPVDVAGASGAATVTAFEVSAKDGSRVNAYDVPVQLG